MSAQELQSTAAALVAEGRGILAADESTGTVGKRLASIGVENTEGNRQAYRQLLFTSPEMESHISGVIMYDETIRQSTDSGVSFGELLAAAPRRPHPTPWARSLSRRSCVRVRACRVHL